MAKEKRTARTDEAREMIMRDGSQKALSLFELLQRELEGTSDDVTAATHEVMDRIEELLQAVHAVSCDELADVGEAWAKVYREPMADAQAA
jgi:hypothetical protein